MAKTKVETITRPKGWSSSFNLIGTVKPTENTFKINQRKEGSDWVYNSMNLGINCGEKHGVIYADMMGGYDAVHSSVIYAHGKNEDNTDDFDNKISVDWNDRLDESITSLCGRNCFINVGLEKTADSKIYFKKFLSPYDAIEYIKNNLSTEEETTICVKGRLKYSLYNEKIQIKKEITDIYLSNVEADKYKATFTQSILIDKDSADIKEIDKTTGILPINAFVLDYLKEINGMEYKAQYPYTVPFEYEFDLTKKELTTKIYQKLFKVSKNVNMITFVGDFVESGATIMPTLDDLTDDIKALIECGVYSEEEALQACADNGNRIRKMVLRKPYIKKNEDGTPIVQIFDDVFTAEELEINIPTVDKTTDNEESEDLSDVNESSDNDMAWLDQL